MLAAYYSAVNALRRLPAGEIHRTALCTARGRGTPTSCVGIGRLTAAHLVWIRSLPTAIHTVGRRLSAVAISGSRGTTSSSIHRCRSATASARTSSIRVWSFTSRLLPFQLKDRHDVIKAYVWIGRLTEPRRGSSATDQSGCLATLEDIRCNSLQPYTLLT